MAEQMKPFPLTAAVGTFVARLQFEAVAAEAVGIIRNGFTDCAATMVLARDEPVTGIVPAEFARAAATPEARLWLSRARTSAPEAALINGTAGHAHEEVGDGREDTAA